MNIRNLFLSLLLLVSGAAQADDWLAEVNQCIAQGEFARAEKIMSKLPKKTRTAQAVRIDSLKTIMGRIRKDFTITPEQGVAMIRGACQRPPMRRSKTGKPRANSR